MRGSSLINCGGGAAAERKGGRQETRPPAAVTDNNQMRLGMQATRAKQPRPIGAASMGHRRISSFLPNRAWRARGDRAGREEGSKNGWHASISCDKRRKCSVRKRHFPGEFERLVQHRVRGEAQLPDHARAAHGVFRSDVGRKSIEARNEENVAREDGR